ncbi:hypothetical protein PR048_019658 [Dryococelus australis]|uniref:Uncharacterized protein n=1 Tax=Dryococelus australis TaxID=614101 RepID=A0ABQ9H454_9NEOP|nr:hypothetical protein PR048_019658 [Dryococelus australis]
MDIMVRFWDENEVKTRFLTSCFMGHIMTHDLLMNFISALKAQDHDTSVSMNGPYVNLKFLKDLQSYLREHSPDDPELLNFGICSLHIVHGAYKTARDKCDWKIPSFLHLFTTSSFFPLKFCCVKWVDNSKVLQRAGAVLPHLKKIHQSCVEKNPPLGFLSSISVVLQSFLTDYQTNRSLLPFTCTDLIQLIMFLMNKIVNHDISTATSSEKLIGIDLTKKCNLKTYHSRKTVKHSLVELCSKLMKKFPLSYKLVRGASCLSPEVMMNSNLRNIVILHANAAIEHNFSSINNRSMYDAVISTGLVKDITAAKQMIHVFRNASAKRRE